MGKLLFLSVLFSIFQLKGQFSQTIVSDRPSQTFSPNTVGKGVLQFQQGVDYYSYHFKTPTNSYFEGRTEDDNLIWDNQIRYGISEDWEVNAIISYQWNYYKFMPDEPYSDPGLAARADIIKDFNNFGLGVRYNLVDGGKDNLSLAGKLRATLDLFEKTAYLDLRLMAALPFYKIHKISSNVALRGLNTTALLYTLNYSLNFSRFSTFVEMYGETPLISSIASSLPTNVYFDFGASYLICDALQLDVQGGLNHPHVYFPNYLEKESAFFVGGGLSWRIRTN